jgi:aspartate-semialdehyde dehydrogenase
MNIAIVGATGNVGRKTLEVLKKKTSSLKIFIYCLRKKCRKKNSFKEKSMLLKILEKFDFSKANITFFAAGGKIAEKYAEKAAEAHNCN